MLLSLRVNKHNPFVEPVLHTIRHCLYRGGGTFSCKHKIADVNSLGPKDVSQYNCPSSSSVCSLSEPRWSDWSSSHPPVRLVAVGPVSCLRCLIAVDFIIMGQ